MVRQQSRGIWNTDFRHVHYSHQRWCRGQSSEPAAKVHRSCPAGLSICHGRQDHGTPPRQYCCLTEPGPDPGSKRQGQILCYQRPNPRDLLGRLCLYLSHELRLVPVLLPERPPHTLQPREIHGPPPRTAAHRRGRPPRVCAGALLGNPPAPLETADLLLRNDRSRQGAASMEEGGPGGEVGPRVSTTWAQ